MRIQVEEEGGDTGQDNCLSVDPRQVFSQDPPEAAEGYWLRGDWGGVYFVLGLKV